MARALRSSKRRWVLRRMTLKRSKSDRALRLASWSRFLAQLVSFHLASISAFAHCFWRVERREPRRRPGMTRGERRHLLRASACRGTARWASEEGPSTRTCKKEENHVSISDRGGRPAPGEANHPSHTRLWSMISTMAASLPWQGWPSATTTMRPTSTRRQLDPSISASPIVTVIW